MKQSYCCSKKPSSVHEKTNILIKNLRNCVLSKNIDKILKCLEVSRKIDKN